jgi:hypothetical protein
LQDSGALHESGVHYNCAGGVFEKDLHMDYCDFSLADRESVVRILERDALKLVATSPAEAVRLVRLAALIREKAAK